MKVSSLIYEKNLALEVLWIVLVVYFLLYRWDVEEANSENADLDQQEPSVKKC